jgi:CBS domain-containing protein
MRAGDVATRPVVDCPTSASALDAAKIMRDAHIGNVVVVEDKAGKKIPVGIVTDRDIVVQLVAKEIDPRDILVGDLMASDLYVAREDEDIHVVIQRMRYRGVRRLPVVGADGAMTGVIALDDLLERLADSLLEVAHVSSRGRRTERQRRV